GAERDLGLGGLREHAGRREHAVQPPARRGERALHGRARRVSEVPEQVAGQPPAGFARKVAISLPPTNAATVLLDAMPWPRCFLIILRRHCLRRTRGRRSCETRAPHRSIYCGREV